jgi:hypothetical protein
MQRCAANLSTLDSGIGGSIAPLSVACKRRATTPPSHLGSGQVKMMLHLPEDGGAAGGAHESPFQPFFLILHPGSDSESTCSILEWRSSNLVATTNGRLVLAYLHRVAASGKLAPETLPEQALISYPGDRNGSPGHLRREDSLTACFFLSRSFSSLCR